MTAWVDTADRLPALPGAYALLVVTPESVPHPSRRIACSPLIPAGVYVYFGSARGPGGIRARCARHLRTDKKKRWHIDHLTCADGPGRVMAAAFPNDTECGLCVSLTQYPDLAIAVPGFGNSDCINCESHLFRIADDRKTAEILDILRSA